jgi:hypothetical protein
MPRDSSRFRSLVAYISPRDTAHRVILTIVGVVWIGIAAWFAFVLDSPILSIPWLTLGIVFLAVSSRRHRSFVAK